MIIPSLNALRAVAEGKGLPKRGTVVHPGDGGIDVHGEYAHVIAAALRQELGLTHQAIKSAMRWTGASERTVKYWFAGERGPNGDHLIALAAHSDVVLAVLLERAGRLHHSGEFRLVEAHAALGRALDAIQELLGVNPEAET
jgi:hypothetical protein